ncbi:MAG: Phosphoheptose isomerase [Firmicutes bacterium ADurb.Bin300]|nr:MAG: Phosphoheptose isomerase [Firmicutes bacterium ADurb.Bin300]
MDIFKALLKTHPALMNCLDDLKSAYACLCDTYERGGKVLVCGNGGSAADSEHIVGELMKGFKLKRELSETQRSAFSLYDNGEYIADNLQNALPAISLVSQTSLITAYLNDVSANMLFAQQVFAYAKKGDTLIALSTSGNSENIITAARVALSLDCRVISITGEDGGKLKADSTVCIRLPAREPYAVQEFTLPVYHALCAAIELRFFGER